MASSVSSERAFSSAGITISKRRNRLKPDIVEALQFLKCLYRRDLLFREEPSTELKVGIEREDLQNSAGTHNPGEAGWDLLITDLAGDEDYADHDDEDVFVQEIV
jgi:hypothetical protein